MDINEIASLVSAVGFPIIMVFLMFKWFTESYKAEQENTRQILGELRDAVNTMTTTIATLINVSRETLEKGETHEDR